MEGAEGLIDEQVTAVVVGIIVIIAGVNAANFYLSNRVTEPFSELGILGPNQQIGGYPTTLVAGQQFSLYGYVGNHEGAVNYYQVLVKLGNESTQVRNSTYARAPELASYGLVLASNESSVFPIGLSLGIIVWVIAVSVALSLVFPAKHTRGGPPATPQESV
jgi:hypothetical protein